MEQENHPQGLGLAKSQLFPRPQAQLVTLHSIRRIDWISMLHYAFRLKGQVLPVLPS